MASASLVPQERVKWKTSPCTNPNHFQALLMTLQSSNIPCMWLAKKLYMLGTYRAGDNCLPWLLYNADSTQGSHLSQRNLGQELFDVRKAHAIGDGLFEILQERCLLSCWNYVPDLHQHKKHRCTGGAAYLAHFYNALNLCRWTHV